MMNKNKLFTATALTVFLTACGSTPPPALLTYPDVNIASLPGTPENYEESGSDKILVVAGKSKDVPDFIHQRFAQDINELVVESGSEVIDRNMAARFAEEIQLKENLAEEYDAYEGPVEAKFVIIPTITSYSYGSSYKDSYTTKDKDGKSRRHPAKCNYKGSAAGNIQIRQLPSMKQIIAVNINDTATSSQENPSSRKCNDTGLINGVISSAIAELVNKGDDNYIVLSKYVGSQGVITAAKSVDGTLYFETSLGRVHGAKANEPVAIYQEFEGELVKIASGEMVDRDNIYTKKSFITVDKKDIPRIKKGMTVMMSGECASIMCSIKTTVDNTKTLMSSFN